MQTIHHESKIDRIEIRVSSEDKNLFKRAAELSGMNNFTAFIIKALKEASVKEIKEHTLIELSLSDQQLFVDSLLKDAPPNQRLFKASKRHKKFI